VLSAPARAIDLTVGFHKCDENEIVGTWAEVCAGHVSAAT